MMKFTLILALLVFVGYSDAGVSFVRWGRTTCPKGAQVLYKGYMTGHHYAQKGSGGNLLCAAQEPKFVRGIAGAQDWSAQLWGVEFEKLAPYDGLFLKDNLPGGELHNQDLLCVVCYVADSTDVLVVPGRDDCYNSGYDLQYKGFLIAEAVWGDRQPSQFVCMDEAPEGRVGGTGDDNNAVVYPVQARCGSLPCNPYVDGMEMTCAVCTY